MTKKAEHTRLTMKRCPSGWQIDSSTKDGVAYIPHGPCSKEGFDDEEANALVDLFVAAPETAAERDEMRKKITAIYKTLNHAGICGSEFAGNPLAQVEFLIRSRKPGMIAKKKLREVSAERDELRSENAKMAVEIKRALEWYSGKLIAYQCADGDNIFDGLKAALAQHAADAGEKGEGTG